MINRTALAILTLLAIVLIMAIAYQPTEHHFYGVEKGDTVTICSDTANFEQIANYANLQYPGIGTGESTHTTWQVQPESQCLSFNK